MAQGDEGVLQLGPRMGVGMDVARGDAPDPSRRRSGRSLGCARDRGGRRVAAAQRRGLEPKPQQHDWRPLRVARAMIAARRAVRQTTRGMLLSLERTEGLASTRRW